MVEIKFHENGQGYFQDLVVITSESFATFVAEQLGENYDVQGIQSNQYRFQVFLTDVAYRVHIKVLTFSFLTKQFEMDNIWKSDVEIINSIFSNEVKA